MVITNNKKLIDKIKVLKALGVNTPPELRKKQGIYDVTNLGLNYRMTDFQAALGVGQINRYKKIFKKEIKCKKIYNEFKGINNIKLQEFSSNNSYFIFQIFLKSKKLEIQS